MAKQKASSSEGSLKDTAREIGSRIGEVHVKASRMVEGMKAAVKASTAALKGKPKKKKSSGARKTKWLRVCSDARKPTHRVGF